MSAGGRKIEKNVPQFRTTSKQSLFETAFKVIFGCDTPDSFSANLRKMYLNFEPLRSSPFLKQLSKEFLSATRAMVFREFAIGTEKKFDWNNMANYFGTK